VPDVLQFPDATLFVCEGEKDADNCAALGLCATTAAGSKWTASCIRALTGRETPFACGEDRFSARDIVILQHNDEAGSRKALAAAQALYGCVKSVRIVLLPGLPADGGDLSDWLEDTAALPRHDCDLLIKLCLQAPPWTPDDPAVENVTDAADDGDGEPHYFPETDVTAWHGKPVPERDWTVQNRIIRRNVALLSSPGGIGKSILIKQLAVAHVLGRDWLVTMPVQGRLLYLNAEDDERELHYRLDAVLAHYGANFDALGDFHLSVLAGKDAVLGEANRHGVVKPTRLFEQLHKRACAVRPVMVALDTAADMFAGN
jgi:hypothetical protein